MSAAVGLDRMSTAQLVQELAAHVNTAGDAGQHLAASLDALRRSLVIGAAVPSRFGGQECDALATNRIIEQVARVDASTAIILFQHYAVTTRIVEWGTPAQQQRHLPRLADGSWIAASAWSETGAGANKRHLSTVAVRTASGWILTGAKAFTTGAGIADLYLVLAQSSAAGTSSTTYGSAGQTFFLVEATNPGLVSDTSLDLIGMRSSATGFINLNSCAVDDGAVLGLVGQAAGIIASVRESGATLGAVSVGIAQAAYDIVFSHARKQGLLEYQAVRHRLVDLGMQVEAARAMVEYSGRRDNQFPGLTTLHSKVFASTTAESVCREALHLLGSGGFVRKHPINQLSADARAVPLMGPTNDLCRELVSQPWTP
jgi:alkylation response protein AidB-like acyl-CoA dehydrogenase